MSRLGRIQNTWGMMLSAQKDTPRGQQEGVKKGTSTGENPRASHEQRTQSFSHDGGVVERVTDGHVSAIGHHHEEEIINITKKHIKIHL